MLHGAELDQLIDKKLKAYLAKTWRLGCSTTCCRTSVLGSTRSSTT